MADYDYVDGDWTVVIQDSGVPSGGRFVAKLQKKTGEQRFLVKYTYGLTKVEALENAQKIIAEYK
jgi:hypothetical protein